MLHTNFIPKQPLRYLVIFVFIVAVAATTLTGNSKKMGEFIIDGCMFLGKPIAHVLMMAFDGTVNRDFDSE